MTAIPMKANQPDSVYLFSYAKHGGTSGLRFAWSADGKQNRMPVCGDFEYVKCGFGPWGREKKMITPHLQQDVQTKKWHCVWYLSESGKALGHTASKDLLDWEAQSYFAPEVLSKYQPAQAYPTKASKVIVAGNEEQGYVQRVPCDILTDLVRFAEHKRYRQQLNDEHAGQDSIRFAGLEPVMTEIIVNTKDAKAISDKFIGIFFEDINYAADGGLYGELIQNRDFEYFLNENPWDKSWGPTKAWSIKGNAEFNIATENPLHANNANYAILKIHSIGASFSNEGYDGINLKKGEKYNFSLWGRIPATAKGGKILIKLLDEKGHTVGSTTISVTSRLWKQRKAVITVTENVKSASLALIPQTTGEYHLDMISLFPQNTFKGRINGLRADLAQTLADLHPRFVRFPGGCVAHGNVWIIYMTGKVLSVNSMSVSLYVVYGAITRHVAWVITNTFSFAKTLEQNLYL